MVASSLRRVAAVIYRHLVLYRQSKVQLYELLYYPTLQMVVWGFVATYLTSQLGGDAAVAVALGLISAFLLWELTLRFQVSVANAFLEEVWSKNLTHLLISPLRPAEFVIGLAGVSLIRVAVGVVPAMLLAWAFYGYNIFALGPLLLLLVVNLLLMGLWLAVLIVGLTLRYGVGAQSYVWSLATTISPLACVFYPVAVLPAWLEPVALALPATHVFEALRGALVGGGVLWSHVTYASLLNLAWLALMVSFCMRQLTRARRKGSLTSMGS